MHFLKGIISDRIRSGKLPKDVAHKLDSRSTAAEQPSAKAVRDGKGQGLGRGATRARSADKG